MRTLLFVLAAAVAACGAETPATEGQAKPLTFEAMAKASLATLEGTLHVPGLQAGVEVLRDRWGVPHIYAANVDDLFFAQGYTIAQDRLWHMEMTRRVAQGRVAEIVGKAALPHDRLVRLLRFRGPFDEKEWTSYHPEARRIFEAYVRGINAFIAQNAANLPVEFKLTGITPEPWKADEILYRARVNAAVASARSELRLAQSVARLGAGEANRRARPEPYGELDVAPGLDFNIITDDVLEGSGRQPLRRFPAPRSPRAVPKLAGRKSYVRRWRSRTLAWQQQLGSQRCADGDRQANHGGRPASSGHAAGVALSRAPARAWMECDRRHRAGTAWVIRGHNGQVAWGRTATGTDEADVFVEELNPANAAEVKWQGAWEPLRVVTESIAVKGAPAEASRSSSAGTAQSSTKIRRITALMRCARR